MMVSYIATTSICYRQIALMDYIFDAISMEALVAQLMLSIANILYVMHQY